MRYLQLTEALICIKDVKAFKCQGHHFDDGRYATRPKPGKFSGVLSAHTADDASGKFDCNEKSTG
jgi:hypothetical protein